MGLDVRAAEAGRNEADTSTPAPTEVGVRIRVHPSLCEGWGNCHRFGPAVYPLDDEGKIDLHLLDVPPELAYQARLGAGGCPNRAITVIEPFGGGPVW